MSGKAVLIGVAALVVVALAVVGGIIFLSPSNDLPTAESCQQEGSKDGTGFTSCLRQLAGGVPDHNRCTAGDGNADVSCTLPGDYTVSYAHVGSQDDVQQVLDDELAKMTQGDHVEAEWKGNGLTGRFRAGSTDGTGVLVFTVKDRPLVGWLTKSADVTPDSLADFFAAQVQPGT